MLYPEKYRQDMEKFSDYLKENPKLRTITTPIGNGEEITIKLGWWFLDSHDFYHG